MRISASRAGLAASKLYALVLYSLVICGETKEQSMDIGFIGLGSMGSAMVANLLKAGHRVRVWNRTAGRAGALEELGAQVVETPAHAFAGDAVLSMLADDAAARA